MLRTCLVLAGLLAMPATASAQLYKYVKKDGTAVYTDRLSELPKQRQRHYAKIEAEKEAQEQEQRAALGDEEYQRQQAEKKRVQLQKAQIAEEERKARLAELDVVLQRLRAKNKKRAAKKDYWVDRVVNLRKLIADKLKQFNALQKQRTQEIGREQNVMGFARLPGPSKARKKIETKIKALEGELDGLAQELNVGIYHEARKAGVPPGWIREGLRKRISP